MKFTKKNFLSVRVEETITSNEDTITFHSEIVKHNSNNQYAVVFSCYINDTLNYTANLHVGSRELVIYSMNHYMELLKAQGKTFILKSKLPQNNMN